MHRTSFVALSFLLLGSLGARAQDEKPVPSPPFVASVADPAQWVVTLSYPEDRDKTAPPPDSKIAAGQIRTILNEKAGNTIHRATTTENGNTTEEWQVGTNHYQKGWDSTTWGENLKDFAPLAAVFPDLDWLSADNYVGTMNYGGHNCFVFAPGAPPKLDLSSPDGATQLDTLAQVAFIDAQSRLPVEVRVGTTYQDYKFGDSPSDQLTLPDDLLAMLKKEASIKAMMNRPIPSAVPQ